MTDPHKKIKSHVIDYYDQEAERYSDLYTLSLNDQEFYPANAIRLEIILEILRQRNVKTLLDIGCGSGQPLLKFLKLGFDAKGIDFSKKMVEKAQELLISENENPDRVSYGDIENSTDLPAMKFDALVATGVFCHNLDEAAGFKNLRNLIAPGGIALVEFRNSLMSLFSLNKYSAPFFWDELIGAEHLPDKLRESTREFLSEKFDTTVESVGKSREIEYTDILSRFHNPLTIAETLSNYDLSMTGLHYYHYHSAPPHLEKNHKNEFWNASLKLEKKNSWKSMFLCSAFVALIERKS